jgi:hypothetical protein
MASFPQVSPPTPCVLLSPPLGELYLYFTKTRGWRGLFLIINNPLQLPEDPS